MTDITGKFDSSIIDVVTQTRVPTDRSTHETLCCTSSSRTFKTTQDAVLLLASSQN
jgi:hypothetical protein